MGVTAVRLVRTLRVTVLALCALAHAVLAHGVNDIRVVSVDFIPTSITWDASSTLRVGLRNNALGGQRQSVNYNLVVPGGLSITSYRLGQDCNAAAVSFDVAGGATSLQVTGLELQPSGTCTVDVTVSAPPAAASYTFTETALAPPGSPKSATLTVTAPALAAMAVSQAEVTFPAQEVGVASAAQAVTVTNTGEGILSISGVAATGDFSVAGCAEASLAPAGSCTLSVGFLPTATGARTGTLTITSNIETRSIGVSGDGIAPLPGLSPSPLAFGNVVVNGSVTSNVTLTNSGTAALTISAIAVSGSSFFSVSDDCPSLLPVQDSCVIAVTYAPTATGLHEGQLSVTSNTLANSRVAALSGTAVQASPVASLSPAAVSFGSVYEGSAVTRSVTLSNTGNAPLAISAVATTGGVFSQSNACPEALAPGASCVIVVTYAPAAAGNHTGQLSVSTNAAASPSIATLSGSAAPVPTPAARLSRTSVAFGSQRVGTASTAQSVVLSSIGNASLVVSRIDSTGDFSVTGCASAVVPSGGACTLAIVFRPSSTGARSGAVTITTDAAGSPHVIALSGTGTAPALALSAQRLEFGAQTLGSASNTQSVIVSNAGTATLEIHSIAVLGDFGFTGCATPLSLAAGESCQLSIKFLPTAIGERSGSVAITTNAVGSPHAIALTGSGTPAPVPGIAVAPMAVDFGTIRVGSSAATHLALSNTGTADLAIAGISLSSPHFAHSSTCPPSLAPRASCDITVTYAPGGEGSHSGELQVASNAVPSPLAVPLFGFATPAYIPRLDLSRTSVDFPSLFVGQTSAPRTVTLLNYGLAPLRINDIVSSGDFGYSGCGTSTTLLTGESCVFSITFRPLSAGVRTGAIEVHSNAPGSPHAISLSGTGLPGAIPEISLAPSHLSFGAQAVGASVSQSMRLTNAGGTALQIASISVTGAFFTQANDCPASLAVGSSCRITVTYAPTSIGAHNAQLVIESNATPGSHVVSLAGSATVVAPAILEVVRAVSFGEQVVGETARRALQLTNAGGEPLVVGSARILLGGAEFGVEGHCATILPGARCTLDVTFTPTGLGDFAARLDIASSHAGGVVQITLAGEGVARPQPGLQLSVDGLGWGNQVVGTLGEERVVRVASTGGEALRIHSIGAGPDFVVNATHCPALLEPMATCDVYVSFKPLVPGPRIGRLLVDSNAVGSADSVSLTGIGCRFFTMGAARNPSRLCSP